jgi:peptide deformylase
MGNRRGPSEFGIIACLEAIEDMSQREILTGEHPILKRKANRIKRIDDSVRTLAADMKETMQHASGVGLAGPQVGVRLRIIVVEIAEDEEDNQVHVELCLCNPEIVRASGEEIAEEACLSLPGWIAEVPRAAAVTVKGMNLEGKEQRIRAKGLLARCLQHEIDHLDGVLFPDRVQDPTTIRRAHRDEEQEDDGVDVLAE